MRFPLTREDSRDVRDELNKRLLLGITLGAVILSCRHLSLSSAALGVITGSAVQWLRHGTPILSVDSPFLGPVRIAMDPEDVPVLEDEFNQRVLFGIAFTVLLVEPMFLMRQQPEIFLAGLLVPIVLEVAMHGRPVVTPGSPLDRELKRFLRGGYFIVLLFALFTLSAIALLFGTGLYSADEFRRETIHVAFMIVVQVVLINAWNAVDALFRQRDSSLDAAIRSAIALLRRR